MKINTVYNKMQTTANIQEQEVEVRHKTPIATSFWNQILWTNRDKPVSEQWEKYGEGEEQLLIQNRQHHMSDMA